MNNYKKILSVGYNCDIIVVNEVVLVPTAISHARTK